MPRQARVVAPGLPHHVTQRGNYRQEVFANDGDYLSYAALINEYCKKYSVDVLAYCLMSNHVHFVVIPAAADSLAKTFRIVHTRHAKWLNKKRDVKGHLWQGRFFSSVLDEAYLYAAVRYVETNPVRAGRVASAWQYRWSSAHAHRDREITHPSGSPRSHSRHPRLEEPPQGHKPVPG
jgi:putative transposase